MVADSVQQHLPAASQTVVNIKKLQLRQSASIKSNYTEVFASCSGNTHFSLVNTIVTHPTLWKSDCHMVSDHVIHVPLVYYTGKSVFTQPTMQVQANKCTLKLVTGAANGCLCLCVSPATDGRPVQRVPRLSP